MKLLVFPTTLLFLPWAAMTTGSVDEAAQIYGGACCVLAATGFHVNHVVNLEPTKHERHVLAIELNKDTAYPERDRGDCSWSCCVSGPSGICTSEGGWGIKSSAYWSDQKNESYATLTREEKGVYHLAVALRYINDIHANSNRVLGACARDIRNNGFRGGERAYGGRRAIKGSRNEGANSTYEDKARFIDRINGAVRQAMGHVQSYNALAPGTRIGRAVATLTVPQRVNVHHQGVYSWSIMAEWHPAVFIRSLNNGSSLVRFDDADIGDKIVQDTNIRWLENAFVRKPDRSKDVSRDSNRNDREIMNQVAQDVGAAQDWAERLEHTVRPLREEAWGRVNAPVAAVMGREAVVERRRGTDCASAEPPTLSSATTTVTTSTNMDGDTGQCAICFEHLLGRGACFNDQLGCHHIMCQECINQAPQQPCPLCRKSAKWTAVPDLSTRPRDWFRMIDADLNGALTEAELQRALSAYLPVEEQELTDEIDRMWTAHWDQDKNGTIDYDEFRESVWPWVLEVKRVCQRQVAAPTAVTPSAPPAPTRLTNVRFQTIRPTMPSSARDPNEWFRWLDQDQSGTLDRQEVANGVAMLMTRLGREQAIAHMHEALEATWMFYDEDNSGQVDLNEFGVLFANLGLNR